MHKHECSGCEHESLKYCKVCNRVYCCECDMEWGNYTYHYHSSVNVPSVHIPSVWTTDIHAMTGDAPVNTCTHSD